MRNFCIYWNVPEYTKVKAPVGCNFGDKYADKHTSKLAAHNQWNDERQILVRKIQLVDKTQHRISHHHHLASMYARKRKMGTTLGVIWT